MKNNLQSLYLTLGKNSCFFLQLVNIAEKATGVALDVPTAAWICSTKGYVYINWDNLNDDDNFWIKQHKEILELLTGKKWSYVKEAANYKAKKNEYIINEWKNGNVTHFDSDDFHSLQTSYTMKVGKIVSKRVFKLL